MSNKEKLERGKQNRTSHFTPHTSQKGITLIALIITVIVMLILVGVTINVALNGGLFEKAETAKVQTEKAVEEEQLMTAIVTAYDAKTGVVDKSTLQTELTKQGNWQISGEGTYEVTSPKGNIYTVLQDGTISEGKGVQVTLPEGLEVGSEFEMDADQNGTAETWIVLHAGTEENSHLNENEIEVISKNVMGETLTLGRGDESAQTPGDIDSDGTANSNVDKAIYSFENSVNRLNSYCEGLIKIKNNGVRSVGSNPSDKSYVNTAHTEDSLVTHLAEWTDAGRTAWNKYKLLAGTTDTNSDTDYNKMNTLGIKVANNSEGTATNYWLASRFVIEAWNTSSSYGSVYFRVRYMNASGNRNGSNLWDVYSRGSTNTYNPAYAVRPVVKLQYP